MVSLKLFLGSFFLSKYEVMLNISGENTRFAYIGAMKRFFKYWIRKKLDWNPSCLLEMNCEGPIPKIPPLEPFALDDVPASRFAFYELNYIQLR